MRFDAGSFLLGLAVISNLPGGSGRVLYSYGSDTTDVDESQNVTNVVDARAVVVPVKPVPVVKPKPVPEPVVPGGNKAPGAPADTAPNEPAPLIPGDKAPAPGNAPNEPAPLVPEDPVAPAPGDKAPAPGDKDGAPAPGDKDGAPAPGDKDGAPAPGDKDGAPAPGDKDGAAPAQGDKDAAAPTEKEGPAAGAKDVDTPELYCPIDAMDVLKKRGLSRRGNGRNCGRSRSTRRTDDEVRTYYDSRGSRAETITRRPRQYVDRDYGPALDSNYRSRRQGTPEDSIEDFMPRTGYDRDYPRDPARWQTWSTYSNGNRMEPTSQISYGRSTDGRDAAVIAHNRFADRDSNRWQMDARGNALRDPNGDYLPAQDWERRTVPVSEQVAINARRSGVLNPPPRRLSLMSENIVNQDGQRAIDMAFNDLGRGRDRLLLRQDSADAMERTHYNRLSGIDNNYSYRNTVGRNRDFDDYDPRDMDVYAGPEYAMSHNYYRRD